MGDRSKLSCIFIPTKFSYFIDTYPVALYSQILKLLSDIHSSTHLSLVTMPTTIQTTQVSQSRPPPSQPWAAAMLVSRSLSSLKHCPVWTAPPHPYHGKALPAPGRVCGALTSTYFFLLLNWFSLYFESSFKKGIIQGFIHGTRSKVLIDVLKSLWDYLLQLQWSTWDETFLPPQNTSKRGKMYETLVSDIEQKAVQDCGFWEERTSEVSPTISCCRQFLECCPGRENSSRVQWAHWV